jgi:type III secretory pathway component EscU
MDFKEQTSKQEQRQTEMESKMKEIKQSVDEAKVIFKNNTYIKSFFT